MTTPHAGGAKEWGEGEGVISELEGAEISINRE